MYSRGSLKERERKKQKHGNNNKDSFFAVVDDCVSCFRVSAQNGKRFETSQNASHVTLSRSQFSRPIIFSVFFFTIKLTMAAPPSSSAAKRDDSDCEEKSNEDQDVLPSDDESFTEAEPKRRKRKRKTGTASSSKRNRPSASATTIPTQKVPTFERLTENGGYAHTIEARLKISRANRGNQPWNKGGKRSNEDKAKIKAGVQSRNRKIFLQKLEKLKMSEQEWLEYKTKIKHARAKLARLRTSVAKVEGQTKDRPLVVDPFVNSTNTLSQDEDSSQSSDEESFGEGPAFLSTNSVPQNPSDDIFPAEIVFKPHPFDSSSLLPNSRSCPTGGPGGLICCTTCVLAYSQYLSSTVQDFEDQKIRKSKKEAQDLLQYLREDGQQLRKSIRMAQTKKKHPKLEEEHI